MSKREKKQIYERKLFGLLDEFDKAFIVHADNVGSKQMQDIRRGLRPESAVLMGKNTLMKRCIRLYCENKKDNMWAALLPLLVGNVGLVFTKGDLNQVKEAILKYKVGAPARVGLVAPGDVYVPAGSTGMDPSNTSFFQALGISTKINKGTIEILTDVHLIKLGEKVNASEATLLSKLGIKPFSYGLQVVSVFDDGVVYDPKVLDISEDDMIAKVAGGIATVAAVCMETGYPTLASLPHSIINGYKNVLAVAVATDYSFPRADKIKEILENPEAFAALAAAAAPAAAAAGGSAPAKDKAAPAKVEEEEDESEEDMGFSLFD